MNVASLELCKELFELSGWWQNHPYSVYDKNGKARIINTRAAVGDTPAYDLGYLLRKLPNDTTIDRLETTIFRASCFIPGEFEDSEPRFESSTPEDATAKLAIELFKSGVLK